MAKNLPKNLQTGLVLWLDGSVDGTTARDVSGSLNNGTTVGSPTTQRVVQNKGWLFNGSSMGITIPNISALLSFSAWIYPTANTKTILLVSSGNTINLSVSNTITFTGIAGGVVYVNGTTVNSISLNVWQHIVCTFTSINSVSGSIANSSFAGNIINPMLNTTTLTQVNAGQLHKATYIK